MNTARVGAASGGDPLLAGVGGRLALAAVLAGLLWAGLWGLGQGAAGSAPAATEIAR
ncbi:hypothetical protein [Paenirhodobacter enshiensis]|uniref:hypothetical protein n=1 Tax=Paenirhodobacter enshiensis TaxID=1105367 RepID=UPI0035B0E1A8